MALSLKELRQIGVAAAPTAGMGVALDLGGRVPVSVLPRMVTGIIPSAGATATAGTGFTYTHTNGTGVYVITFTQAFTVAPVVFVTTGGGGVARYVDTSAASTAGFTVTIANNVPAATDTAFYFIAAEVR